MGCDGPSGLYICKLMSVAVAYSIQHIIPDIRYQARWTAIWALVSDHSATHLSYHIFWLLCRITMLSYERQGVFKIIENCTVYLTAVVEIRNIASKAEFWSYVPIRQSYDFRVLTGSQFLTHQQRIGLNWIKGLCYTVSLDEFYTTFNSYVIFDMKYNLKIRHWTCTLMCIYKKIRLYSRLAFDFILENRACRNIDHK